MATPKADALVLRFRRDVADLYDKTTGLPITASTQDGNVWSSTEIGDLLVEAINEYITQFAQEAQKVSRSVGKVLQSQFEEYITPVLLPIQLQALPGQYGSGYAEVNLPSDFSYMVSASVSEGSTFRRLRYLPLEDFDKAVERWVHRELASPYYTLEATKIRLISHSTPLNGQTQGGPVQTNVELRYIHPQINITLGGGTDILLRPVHNAFVLRYMTELANRYAK